jgi:hypothetical protein
MLRTQPHTAPERVALFLKAHPGTDFCDDCLRDLVELTRRQQAQQATSALSASTGFNRDRRVCSRCRSPKKVIRAL